MNTQKKREWNEQPKRTSSYIVRPIVHVPHPTYKELEIATFFVIVDSKYEVVFEDLLKSIGSMIPSYQRDAGHIYTLTLSPLYEAEEVYQYVIENTMIELDRIMSGK